VLPHDQPHRTIFLQEKPGSSCHHLGRTGVWEIFSFLNIFPKSAFPSPMEVLVGFGEEIRTGRMLMTWWPLSCAWLRALLWP